MLVETKEKRCNCGLESTHLGGVFDIAGKEARAAELETLTVSENFWQDQEKAQTSLKNARPWSRPSRNGRPITRAR